MVATATKATTPSEAETTRVERQMVEVVAAVCMAGEEPSVEAIEAARAVLSGEMSADEAIRVGFAALEKRHGIPLALPR